MTACLTKLAEEIKESPEGLAEALAILSNLTAWLRPRLPAAGLAAPQIGISKRVFIFSWDRSEANLRGAINPSYQAIGNDKSSSWEGCFSVPLSIAKVPRFEKIVASYTNERGAKVRCRLEAFAARVFQHECDHLQGIVNTSRSDIEVMHFENIQAMWLFMDEVKKGDAVHYVQPVFED